MVRSRHIKRGPGEKRKKKKENWSRYKQVECVAEIDSCGQEIPGKCRGQSTGVVLLECNECIVDDRARNRAR